MPKPNFVIVDELNRYKEGYPAPLKAIGLGSPTSLAEFLNSSTGKKVVGVLTQQINAIAHQEQQQLDQQLEQSLRRERCVAMIHLAKLAERESAMLKLNQAIQKQIDVLFAQKKELKTQQAGVSKSASGYQEILKSYTLAIAIIDGAIGAKVAELEQLEGAIVQIQAQQKAVNTVALATKAVLNQQASRFVAAPFANKQPAQQLDELKAEISQFSPTLDPTQSILPEVAKRLMILEQYSLLRGTSYLVDQEGQRTTDAKAAKYSIPADQEFVRQNGTDYIVPKGTSFDLLSPEQRDNAQLDKQKGGEAQYLTAFDHIAYRLKEIEAQLADILNDATTRRALLKSDVAVLQEHKQTTKDALQICENADRSDLEKDSRGDQALTITPKPPAPGQTNQRGKESKLQSYPYMMNELSNTDAGHLQSVPHKPFIVKDVWSPLYGEVLKEYDHQLKLFSQNVQQDSQRQSGPDFKS